MSQLQKYAWFNLVAFALMVVVYVLIVLAHRDVAGRLQLWTSGVLGAMGFSALWALSISMIWRSRRGRVVRDEREVLIWQRATRIAYGIFWSLFVIACLALWGVGGSDKLIPASTFLYFLWGAWITFMVAQSLAIVFQYGREESHVTE
jgi:uncharacterized membrane protein